ncbi:hypothetical protein BaRGS_00015805, partial [Batillaria attramentaria]
GIEPVTAAAHHPDHLPSRRMSGEVPLELEFVRTNFSPPASPRGVEGGPSAGILGCIMWILGYDMWIMGCIMWILGYDMWILGCIMWILGYDMDPR